MEKKCNLILKRIIILLYNNNKNYILNVNLFKDEYR